MEPETPAYRTVAEEVAALRTQVREYQRVVELQEAKIQWLTRMMFSAKTERRPAAQQPDTAQQESFLTAPVTAVATDPASAAEQVATEQQEAQTQAAQQTAADRRNAKKGRGPGGAAKAKNGGGRRPVNRDLRIVETVIEAPAHERIAADGTQLVLLGYELSEREHFIAAELVRQICKREQWGLPDTRAVAYVAPVPPAIVPKGKYSDDVISEAMYRKYVMCLPFGRMLGDFRAMGSDLSDAQLSDLARRFATFLSPIAQAIRTQVLARAFVHVDETPLLTLDGRRTLWAWVGGNQAFFHVGGRGAKELRTVLGLPQPGRKDDPGRPEDQCEPGETLGWIFTHWMADGYRPYDTIAAEADIIRLCCWSHARRDFVIPTESGDPLAKDLIDRIAELYRIERDTKHVSDCERQQRRQQDAIPILDGIRTACTAAQMRYDPASVMYKAVTYILKRWAALTAYTTRGDLPIDNNQAERVIRPIVIGRKNWYFIGSEDATEWASTNFTLFESCRLAKAEPRAWLRHVIARLHAGDTDYASMTPATCAGKCPARS